MRSQLLEDINQFMGFTVKVEKLYPNAQLPERAHPQDAGADLFSVDNVVIAPLTRVMIHTGIAIQNLNPLSYFRIAPRSGLAAHKGIDVFAGVVDCNYTGEIKVILFNSSNEEVTINKGDKIAQLIMEQIFTPGFEWTEKLEETDRGEAGFGSSDSKS